MATVDGRGPPDPRRGGWKWWHGMIAGMLLMLSPASALLLLGLLAPALLAGVSDSTPGRVLTRTVLLFALAASLDPMRACVAQGATLQAAIRILSQPGTLAAVWLCGGCGWMLNELLCGGADFITRRKLASRREALEARLLEIKQEWSLAEHIPPPG